jgi:hypothetical protein
VITVDLGSRDVIMDGEDDDLVFFEKCEGEDCWESAPNGFVSLGSIVIEISQDQQDWHQVFHWGDNITDTHTNVASYAAGGEQDGERIEPWDLFGSPGTGIAIDINFPSGLPFDARYRYVRLSCPVGHDCHYTDVDAIERLP